MLIDSHCHLTDGQFEEDRPQLLARAKGVGVEKILTVCSDRADAERVADLVKKVDSDHPRLWGTAGVHPHEAEGALDGDLDAIRDLLMAEPRLVAVGETGLDFYYDHSPRTRQEELFRDHLSLAEGLNLPVVVHNRSSDPLMEQILSEWGGRVRGVLHCFTGGRELLDTALRLGWMISFTGMITFKKYEDADLVRRVPRDRLMVETDAPYLAPVPHRGRRNEPAFVAEVVKGLSMIRGEDLEDVQGYTSANATRFFDLSP